MVLRSTALILCATVVLAFLTGVPAHSQTIDAATINGSVTITTGSAYQTVLAAVAPPALRRSLTLQNDNTNGDNCWLYIGSGTATKGTSILLTPGTIYTRQGPYVPTDEIQGTCASANDTIYVDTQ